jgi:hypothetical protein
MRWRGQPLPTKVVAPRMRALLRLALKRSTFGGGAGAYFHLTADPRQRFDHSGAQGPESNRHAGFTGEAF